MGLAAGETTPSLQAAATRRHSSGDVNFRVLRIATPACMGRREACPASDGHLVHLPVTSEEDGRTDTVSRFGLRVSDEVFEQVRRDKNDDGIVQRNVVGEKRRGQLAVDYRMPVLGGAIIAW